MPKNNTEDIDLNKKALSENIGMGSDNAQKIK